MEDEFDQSAARPSRWRKPLLAVLVLLFVLAGLPFAIRTSVLSRIPEIGNPFDPALLDGFAVPVDENAYTYYRLAGDQLVDEPPDVQKLYAGRSADFGDLVVRCYTDGWQHADEHVRAQLERNRPALEAWRLGADQEEARYHNPLDVDVNTLLTVDQNLRGINRWALVEAARLTAEGNPAESWEWIHAGFRSSRHLGSYGCLISRLVGAANHSACTQAATLWAGNPQVTADELRTAIRNITDSYAHTPTNVEVLHTEYIRIKKGIVGIFGNHPDYERFLADWGRPPMKFPAYVRGEPDRSLRLNDHYFANQLAHADQPRRQRPPFLPGGYNVFNETQQNAGQDAGLTPQELDRALQRTNLLKAIILSTSVFYDATDRELARHRCLLVALAAQAYYRVHNRFPDELEQLVPDYLSKVPADPFSPTAAPLRFVSEQDQLCVYSVSLNGADDGGAGIMPQTGGNSLDEGIEIHAPGLQTD